MRVNLLSGLFGALSAASLAVLLAMLSERDRGLLGEAVSRKLRIFGGPIAGVLFVFSETHWMRSTLSEVNAMNLFLLFPWAFYLWLETSRGSSVRLLAPLLLVLGLATVDHAVTVAFGLPLAAWMFLRPWFLKQRGATVHLLQEMGAWLLQGLRATTLLLPILVYLVIRGDCPALLIWGVPDKVSGLTELLLLKEYEGRCFEPTTFLRSFYRVKHFLTFFPFELGWVNSFAWCAGFFWLLWRIRKYPARAKWSAALTVITIGLFLMGGLTISHIMTVERHVDFRGDIHPYFYLACCYFGIGTSAFLSIIRRAKARLFFLCGMMSLAVLPALFNLYAGWGRSDYGAPMYTRELYGELGQGALFVPSVDNQAFLPFTLRQIGAFRTDVSILTPYFQQVGKDWREALKASRKEKENAWSMASRLMNAPLQFPGGQVLYAGQGKILTGYTVRVLARSVSLEDAPSPPFLKERRTEIVERVGREWAGGTLWDRRVAATVLADMAAEWSREGKGSPGAMSALEWAQRLYPDNPEICSRLAGMYGDAGMAQIADRYFRAACGLQKWDPTPYLNYGIWLRKQSRPHEAVSCFLRAARVSRILRGVSFRELGGTYASLGEMEKGRQFLNRAALWGAQDISLLALSFLDAGDPYRASELLNERITQQPDDWEAREWLARALEQQGDLQGAIEQHHWLIQYGPHPAGHWLELGTFLASSGRMDGAVDAWGRCLDLDPDPQVRSKALGNLEKVVEMEAQLPQKRTGAARKAKDLLNGER